MTTRVLVLVVAVACGGGKGGGPATSSTTTDTSTANGSAATGTGAEELTGVGVALDVEPNEATVTVDDVVLGKVSELDPVIALAPGLHTLVLAHPGFKSYRVEFSVTDKVEKFVVKLDAAK